MRRGSRRRATAGAQTLQLDRPCTGGDSPKPGIRIPACTAMIQSGQYAERRLAILFNNRCSAYARDNADDLAIKDCEQAIKLDANYGLLYCNLSVIHYNKKDYDRAGSQPA
jgi:hypothetical protein